MKIQINILILKLKENIKWFILLILLLVLCLILYHVGTTENSTVSTNDFLMLLNYPSLTNYSSVTALLAIYNFVLYIYIAYVFYTYEFNFSFQNIILRAKDNIWILSKIIIFSLFTIFYKSIYAIITYTYFKNEIPFSIDYIVAPILFNLLCFLSGILTYNFYKRKKIYTQIITLMIPFVLYFYFNYISVIFILIIELIVSIKYFKFKNICINRNWIDFLYKFNSTRIILEVEDSI